MTAPSASPARSSRSARRSSPGSKTTISIRSRSCNGAIPISISPRIDRLKDSLRATPVSQRLTRDPRRRRRRRARCAERRSGDRRTWPARRPRSSCSGKSARSRTTARSPPANHAELAGTLYKFLMSDAGVIPEDWFAGPGRARRPHRRRHRHAVEPHRPYPHLDLRLQPRRLAGRWRPLARAHPRHRGHAVRRAARAPDPALRRPPHQRADEEHAGQGHAVCRHREHRPDLCREALCRQARRLPLHARYGGGRRPRQGRAPRGGQGAGGRADQARRAARATPRTRSSSSSAMAR